MWKTMNYLRKKSPKSQFYVDFGLGEFECGVLNVEMLASRL